MVRNTLTEDPTPVAIYDIENKKPIGVFRSSSVAARYLFPLKEKGSMSSKITDRAMRRSRMYNTSVGTVAVRYANTQQKEDLKKGPRGLFYIYPGYPQMDVKKFVAL